MFLEFKVKLTKREITVINYVVLNLIVIYLVVPDDVTDDVTAQLAAAGPIG